MPLFAHSFSVIKFLHTDHFCKLCAILFSLCAFSTGLYISSFEIYIHKLLYTDSQDFFWLPMISFAHLCLCSLIHVFLLLIHAFLLLTCLFLLLTYAFLFMPFFFLNCAFSFPSPCLSSEGKEFL